MGIEQGYLSFQNEIILKLFKCKQSSNGKSWLKINKSQLIFQHNFWWFYNYNVMKSVRKLDFNGWPKSEDSVGQLTCKWAEV